MVKRILVYLCLISVIVCSLAVAGVSAYAAEDLTADSEIVSEEESEVAEKEESIFILNENAPRDFYYDGELITLYLCDIAVDMNNDGETTASDARVLLRISAELEAFEGNLAKCDMNGDNAISANDARLLLRYSAQLDTYYSNKDNFRLSGFVKDTDGDTCYFSDYGALASGYMAIDGSYYYFNAEGAMCTGVVYAPNGFYYMNEEGKGIEGFMTISGSRYYFVKGKAQSGWFTVDNNRYYGDVDYKIVTGNVKIGGDIYGFAPTGEMYNGFVTLSGKTYYYAEGKLYTGALTLSGSIYYFDKNGVMYTGIQKINGETYYFESNGKAAKGLKTVGSDLYFFGDDGKAVKGLKNVNGSLYNFGTDGKATKGLATISGKLYYFGSEYKAVAGLIKLNGEVYCFSKDFTGSNGFVTTGSDKYYIKDGKALKGWLTVSSKRYYAGSDYKIVTGNVKIDGVVYGFNSAGEMLSGFATMNNNTYYYQNGKLYTGWLYNDLDVYYFYSDGRMAKNTSIGDVSFNASGIASAKKITEATLPVHLRTILKQNGRSVSAIYNYVHNNYRYKYYDKLTPDAMVVRILTNKRGACYDFANLTKYLLEIAGYECKIVVGKAFNPNNPEHDWVLVKVNGVWRHLDAQRGTYLKTDAQMKNLGYKWTAQGLPAAK